MLRNLRALLSNDSGVSSVEYALLLALVSVALIAAVITLGGQVSENIDNATEVLTGV